MGDRSLSDTHAALHEALDGELLEVLTALVEREAPRARAALARFHQQLTAHARQEEALVLPLLEGRGLTGAKSPQHIVPEHALLERTCVELAGVLASCPDAPSARAVVSVLPLAYRLRGIYEHHTERERLLYPLLDTHGDAAALAAALRAAASDPGAAPGD